METPHCLFFVFMFYLISLNKKYIRLCQTWKPCKRRLWGFSHCLYPRALTCSWRGYSDKQDRWDSCPSSRDTLILKGWGSQRQTSKPLLDIFYVYPSRENLCIYEQIHIILPPPFSPNEWYGIHTTIYLVLFYVFVCLETNQSSFQFSTESVNLVLFAIWIVFYHVAIP